jgi:hypothetical protein
MNISTGVSRRTQDMRLDGLPLLVIVEDGNRREVSLQWHAVDICRLGQMLDIEDTLHIDLIGIV